MKISEISTKGWARLLILFLSCLTIMWALYGFKCLLNAWHKEIKEQHEKQTIKGEVQEVDSLFDCATPSKNIATGD